MPTDMTHQKLADDLVSFVQAEFRKAQDTKKAASMQQYLKTKMPIYGLQKPERAIVEKKMHNEFSSVDFTQESCQHCIQTLWDLPHREEKYLAIDFSLKHKRFLVPETIGLYENMLREDYMWWDLVDPIATSIVGRIALDYKEQIEPTLCQWIKDDNMWIRRAAILAQLRHKKKTNETMLFEFCRLRMHEKEFFIRKAIGWALREHSKTNPGAVIAFLEKEKDNLSVLSYKEGAKVLIKKGKM